MKGWLSSKRTFYKFLLTYIILLSFTLTGILYIVNLQLKEEFRQSQLSRRADELTVSIDAATDKILDINKMYLSMRSDISLILSRYRDSAVMRAEAIVEMRKYISGVSLIQDVLYIDTENDVILSTAYYADYTDGEIHLYTENRRHVIRLDAFGQFDAANQIIRHDSGGRVFLLYSPRQDHTSSKMLFIFNQYELSRLLELMLSQTVHGVALIDGNRNILLSTDPALIQPKLDRAPVPAREWDDFWADEDLALIPLLSPDVSLLAYSNPAILQEQLFEVFRKSYLVILLIAMCGVLFTVLSMRITYNPIVSVIRRITKNASQNGDRIEDIVGIFDKIVLEKEKLQATITKYRLAIQRSLLDTLLLHGEGANKDAFSVIDHLFDSNNKNYIVVVSVSVSADTLFDDICAFLAGTHAFLDICLLTSQGPASFKFLLNDTRDQPMDDKENTLRAVINALQERFTCRAAVSDASPNPLDIARLYDNSEIAMGYSKDHSPSFFQDIESPVTLAPKSKYPYDILDSISDYMEEHNFVETAGAIDQLVDLLDDDTIPDFFARCVLIDAVSTIIYSMNLSNIRFERYSAEYLQALYLCRSSDYRKNTAQIKAAFHSMLDIFEQEAESNVLSLVKIRSYIHKNAFSSTFSAVMLAEAFNTSTAYMSYLYKKLTGETITEYVWQLRLSRAKTLLAENSYSIDQISNLVGYDNPSSFRRRFKESVGCTPSEFRLQDRGMREAR